MNRTINRVAAAAFFVPALFVPGSLQAAGVDEFKLRRRHVFARVELDFHATARVPPTEN